MRADGAAVFFSTLDRASPALGMAIAGGKSRNCLVVDLNGLGVVPTAVIKFVYMVLLADL